jgi:hypothetical protein
VIVIGFRAQVAVGMGMFPFVAVLVLVGMGMRVLVGLAFFVGMLVLMSVRVFMGVRMGALLMLVIMLMLVPMFVIVIVIAALVMRVLLVRRAAVDVELHALDILPLRAIVMHVKVAEVQLAEFPLERARLHAEIDQRADHHVAADSGDAVQVKSFHAECLVAGRGGKRKPLG